MAHKLKIATANEVTREVRDFAETETFLDIKRSIALIRAMDGSAVTMIAGGAGSGKTTALKQIVADDAGDTWYSDNFKFNSTPEGAGTAYNLATHLFGHPSDGKRPFRSLADALQKFCWVASEGTTLILDEAQHLTQTNSKNGIKAEALGWIVDVADHVGFSLVLCGNLDLARYVRTNERLNSRMRRPIVLSKPSEKDVRELLIGTPFGQANMINALYQIAQLPGALRNVQTVTEMAMLYAASETLNEMHLKAAIGDFKRTQRGVF